MFENARLKVCRAKQHIVDFHDMDTEFFKTGPCSFIFVTDPKIGKSWFQFRQHKSIPPEFALVIGDAIHNLRSALDQLVWEIIEPLGPKKPDRVQFPFCEKSDGFESVIKMREVHLARKEIVDAIRQTKPYADGNGELFLLHRLDIADKHKLTVGVQSLVAPSGFEDKRMEQALADIVRQLRGVAFVPYDDGVIGETPYQLPLTRAERRARGIHKALSARREKKMTADFSSAFVRGQPFGGYPVIPVLARLESIVTGVIDDVTAAAQP